MPSTEGADDGISPRDRSTLQEAMESMGGLPDDLDTLETRVADPDFQATVTDFLDFTEYLPSDTIRSMTLIGKLDKTNKACGKRVDELTRQWSQLPELPQDERPNPVALRAEISQSLSSAVSSRVYAHAEAQRIHDNVNRHRNRIQYILEKLIQMRDKFPTEEEQQKSPILPTRSPNVVRAKAARVGAKESKICRPRVPRITVPGDVLAPYELNYTWTDDGSDDDSESSDDDSIDASLSPVPAKRGHARATPAPQPKIKIVKTPKAKASKASKEQRPKKAPPTIPLIPLSALKPPPENAVIGSPDAPWLQLTLYELAKLRKRMKKNANWTPSETMVARELKNLGRGPEAFREAKKKAEDEGLPWDPVVPKPEIDPVTGQSHLPPGAMGIDSVTANEIPTSNRGMKLNEAKKLKRDMAKQAAQEAEESARKFEELARRLIHGDFSQDQAGPSGSSASRKPSRSSKKRKRDSISEMDAAKPELGEGSTQSSASRPAPPKRAKTETPVPPPMLTPSGSNVQAEKQPTPASGSQPTSDNTPVPSASRVGSLVVHSQTPVPLPILPHHTSSHFKKTISASPPAGPASGSVSSAVSAISGSKARDHTDPSPVPEAGSAAATITTATAAAAATVSTGGDGKSNNLATATPAANNGSASGPGTSTSLQIPLKPAHETQVPLPIHSPKKTPTPILPPTRESSRRLDKRAADTAQAKSPAPLSIPPTDSSAAAPTTTTGHFSATSRAETPKSATPAPELPPAVIAVHPPRRPPSRSAKASSQEPSSATGLAVDRPRRASTARNTPVRETAPPGLGGGEASHPHHAGGGGGGGAGSRPSTATAGRRSKRPAPGVVSTTTNGSNSAVGRRKAATRKKARAGTARRKDLAGDAAGGRSASAAPTTAAGGNGGGGEAPGVVMEEVDDEGNVIDPDEPRYCLCNRVSFGTMIQCENVDHCRGEWFHLECVGLTDIPARTTKWYCPDCRKALNIGEKGEVSARGVRM